MSLSQQDAPASDAGQIAADIAVLRRGVLVNAAGYVVKLGMPVLLALGTRTYGATAWGIFVTVQSLLLIAVRITLVGLDKAMLWWVPTRGAAGSIAMRSTLALVIGTSSAFALAVAWLGEPLLRLWQDVPDGLPRALKIMALGLPPFAATDLLLHACMGRRRMEPNVFVRETLTPASLIAIALWFHAVGATETGLAWAFVLSNLGGLLAALWFYRTIFGSAQSTSTPRITHVPRELLGYAVPLWLAEVLNSSLMRVNTLVIASFAGPVAVAVWSVVSQFGVAVRTIRGAFDSIVTVLAADISRNHDSRRLSATLSYAAQLVALTQFPLFAFLALFADLILPLYGEAFGRGSWPLIILCAFWLANGAAGLAGVVVVGYGKSRFTLFNTLVTIASQLVLLALLVPTMDLAGASIAVGASYSLQHIVQLIQLRILTGSFHFSRRAAQPLVPATIATCVASAAYFALRAEPMNPWVERSLTFASFAVSYGLVTLWHWKRGDLRAPTAEQI